MFFVCLFWKVGCVSTDVVTVFVFFPSVLPVIRTVLILFLQLTRGSLKRRNQYPLLIPHTAASYLKPCPCYFFLLHPFFQELTQNYDALAGQMFSLLLFRSFFASVLFFSLPSLLYPQQTVLQMKPEWKQNFAFSIWYHDRPPPFVSAHKGAICMLLN